MARIWQEIARPSPNLAAVALSFLLLSVLVVGYALSEWLWRSEATDYGGVCLPLERIGSSLLLALVVWLALNWLLSDLGALAFAPLMAGAAVLTAGGGFTAWRLRRDSRKFWKPLLGWRPALPTVVILGACAPLVLWTAYALFRGHLLPVANHDALSYHLPRAMVFWRSGGYRYIKVADVRLAGFPCDYELLMADFLGLTGTGSFTAWFSTFTWLFAALAAAALIERWWGPGLHTLACGLFFAGMPVCLLGSAQQKNDFLMAALIMLAILWTARWCTQGGRAPLLLGALATECAVGTKLNAIFLVVTLLPFLVWAIWKRRSRRGLGLRVLAVFTFVVVSAMLLGAWVYPSNLVHAGNLIGRPRLDYHVSSAIPGYYSSSYGQYSNFWMYPVELLTAPFEFTARSVYNPFARQWWFWPHHQFFYSDYGGLFTVLLFAVPWCIRRWSGTTAPGRSRSERLVGCLMLLISFLLALPLKTHPAELFASFPRYTLQVVPLVLGWSLAPAIVWLVAGGRKAWTSVILVGLAAVITFQAVYSAVYDDLGNLGYVRLVMRHPGLRLPSFGFRAANLVDLLAGPQAEVAVDVAPEDTWIYPLYGRHLTRRVVFLSDRPKTVIPPGADWVVIDYTTVYGLRQANAAVTGRPRGSLAHALRLYRALVKSPAWECYAGKLKRLLPPFDWVFYRRRPGAPGKGDG